MNYIIIDMEWNQPVSFDSGVFKKYGDRLLFEIIQIGAVKLNSNLEIIDSKSMLIKPAIYKVIQSHVRKITGIDDKMLVKAPRFPQAIEEFAAWCGEDYIFAAWGADDVSVMQQNMTFFKNPTVLSDFYDLQHLYSDAFDKSGRSGLKNAMEDLHIEPETGKDFHNALNDAYYTALVAQKIPGFDRIVQYRQTAHPLHRSMNTNKGYIPMIPYPKTFDTVAQVLEDETIQHLPCPVCGKKTIPDSDKNANISAGYYFSIARCPQHGDMLVRFNITLNMSGSLSVATSIVMAKQRDVRYVHTKKFQERQREEEYFALHHCYTDREAAVRNGDDGECAVNLPVINDD